MVSNADPWGTTFSPLIPLAATFSDLHTVPATVYGSSSNGEPRDISAGFDVLLTSALAIAVMPN